MISRLLIVALRLQTEGWCKRYKLFGALSAAEVSPHDIARVQVMKGGNRALVNQRVYSLRVHLRMVIQWYRSLDSFGVCLHRRTWKFVSWLVQSTACLVATLVGLGNHFLN